MSETAFEKFWREGLPEEYDGRVPPIKLFTEMAWNAAIDAAMERCRYIRDTSIKACESNTSENCRTEIQKLRGE